MLKRTSNEQFLDDLHKEVRFHWDSIEFELLLTLSLKYQHELNNFTVFEDYNVEELRFFYYLFKLSAFQEKSLAISEEIPSLVFRNFKENALPLSFIKDFSLKNGKALDFSLFKLSEDSLDRYKYFLRNSPKPAVFLNSLLMRHCNTRFSRVVESLQRIFFELLAETLFLCNYQSFVFYLSHLRTFETLSSQSLKSLFEVFLEILEEEEAFEVFYRDKRYVPNEKILNKLKVLANLQETRGNVRRNLEVLRLDEENLLVKGKVIEALIVNGEMSYLGLLNEVEEKFVCERNRKTPLPVAFQKLKMAKFYLERNRE